MKRLVHIALLGFLTCCNSKEVKKVVEDEKLQNDSEVVVEDLIDLGEELIRDELNIPKKEEKK